MSLQVIYIYVIEDIISFGNRNSYIISNKKPKSTSGMQMTKDNTVNYMYCDLQSYKYVLHISLNLINNYNLKNGYMGNKLIEDYLNNIRLITFDELLKLIVSLEKDNTIKNWDVFNVISLLQLVVAKWDDWN